MKVINALNYSLNKFGLELKRFPDIDLQRRMRLINSIGIDKILDIGASVGNYALLMRKLGFKGKIISFEPLTSSYRLLKLKAKRLKDWKAINCALGDFDGASYINVAKNSDSSSLLEMLPSHEKSAPESIYIHKEQITVKRIDTIFDKYCTDNDRLYMKIDAQGFELAILEGAQDSLSKFKAIQLEMSLMPLYKGAISYLEMIEYLKGKGFQLFCIENGFSDPENGQLLQVDGIFRNIKCSL